MQAQSKRNQSSSRNPSIKTSGAAKPGKRGANAHSQTRVDVPEDPLTSYRVLVCRVVRCRQTNCWYGHTRREIAAAQEAARAAWEREEKENSTVWKSQDPHHVKIREWYLTDKKRKKEASAGA